MANTHWDDRGLKAREESAKLILARIEQEIRGGKAEGENSSVAKEPLVILLGDLNSPAEEAGYQVLTGGRYPAASSSSSALKVGDDGRSFFDSRHELVVRGSKLAAPGAVSGFVLSPSLLPLRTLTEGLNHAVASDPSTRSPASPRLTSPK